MSEEELRAFADTDGDGQVSEEELLEAKAKLEAAAAEQAAADEQRERQVAAAVDDAMVEAVNSGLNQTEAAAAGAAAAAACRASLLADGGAEAARGGALEKLGGAILSFGSALRFGHQGGTAGARAGVTSNSLSRYGFNMGGLIIYKERSFMHIHAHAYL